MAVTKILILILSFINHIFTDCILDISRDFTHQHPLILDQSRNEFIVPNNNGRIRFVPGHRIRLVCSGPSNRFTVATHNVQEVIATCIQNKIFTVSNSIGQKPFIDLHCANTPESTARRTGRTCASSFTEIEIGFNTNAGFVLLMTNCFDDANKNSLYSKFDLSSQIGSQQRNAPRPTGFSEQGFTNNLGRSLATIYFRATQIRTFQQILGNNHYISPNNDYFLSKGHLTANMDLLYTAQQYATFYFVNAAPQWQTFNGANWNELEISVRNLARTRNLNLIVYTGVFGISQLPDANNRMKNLYLNFNNRGGPSQIAVPKIFWKIVYDPITKLGTTFIGHNNPYENIVLPVCADVSNRINWLTPQLIATARNVVDGYLYSCDYHQLQLVVPYLPPLQINGLLV